MECFLSPPQKRPKHMPAGCRETYGPTLCFSSNSSKTTESLLKGDRWAMVRALESSGKASCSEHSLGPIVFV